MTEEFYTQQIEKANSAIAKTSATFRLWISLRLSIFLVTAVGIYFTWGNWRFTLPIFVLGVALFLLAVTRFEDARTALNKAKKWKELAENEQKALNGDFSMFDHGEEFRDAKHPFAHDLDLFAPHGVFQFLNRTFSPKGKKFLADLLKNGAKKPTEINELINGLHEDLDWCMQFRVNGSVDERKEALNGNLTFLKTFDFKNPKWMPILRFFLAFIGVASFIALVFNLISGMIFTIIVLVNLFLVGSFLKETNRIIATIAGYEGKIKFLVDQMALIKTLQSKNETLRAFAARLDGGNESAIAALKELLQIHKRFEFRMNLLVGVMLNMFLVWDFHQRIALKKWLDNYRTKIGDWEEDLVKLEAYVSGAFLKFNDGKTIFATFHESDDILVSNLRHPLISKGKVVSNNVQFDTSHRLMILTGPNMAGKSTYLRSVGLLFVLANAGFPIFAEKANLPRYELYSSMRTSDDLSTESSYFYAELARLKFILDEIESGRKIFLLLDEILKGTNSIDKEQGSKQFLQKLKRLHTQGIIATHDLALCELSNGSEYFFNGYFDSIIQNDELYFDYSWKAGVCQNMNASFLLKKMKLVD